MTTIVKLEKTASVKGLVKRLKEGLRDVYYFTGIPYAEAPIGKLRFKPPQPKKLWNGVKDCTKFGAISPQNIPALKLQMRPFPIPSEISEDCLFLNIYTPTVDVKSKLPVMFWIHGGAFAMGMSNFYEGTALSTFHDVVIVTINYRLGPFGFLATGDGHIGGNMGLLDQIQALKWVQTYIDKFGGDRNNVTLFGESAGAISIALHLLSPLTKGLFHKAICQSGSALHPGGVWSLQNASKYLLKRLKIHGFASTDSEEILKYLQTLSSEEIQTVVGEGIQPVIDGTYLPESPQILYQKGLFHKDIDLIIGYNTHEGAMFIDIMNRTLFKNSPLDSLSKANQILDMIVDVYFYRGCKNSKKVKEVIRSMYLEGCKSDDDFTQALVEIYGDLLFVAPSVKCAMKHAEKASGKTFVYQFAHKLPIQRYDYDWLVTDHGEEILLVFGEPFLERFPVMWREDDEGCSHNLMALWCHFAKYGNPATDENIWPCHTVKGQELALLHSNCVTLISHQQTAKLKLWNETIPQIIQTFSPSKY